MKQKTKIILFTIFCLSLFSTVSADFDVRNGGYDIEINVENWAYYKEINVPEELSFSQPFWIEIDEEVFLHAKTNLVDLRIVNSKGIESPRVSFMTESNEIAHGSEIILPSSVRPSFRNVDFAPLNMIDGDNSSFYQSDYSKDTTSASFVVDLKHNFLTHKLSVRSSDSSNTWQYVRIEGSNDLSSWVEVKTKTKASYSTNRQVIYPESNFRYLRFTFWHNGSLKIEEIEIYSASEAKMLFLVEIGESYRLYYGNSEAYVPNYNISGLYSDINTKTLSLGAQMNNPSSDNDYDNDGINNSQDNCALNYNSDQKDTDKDQIGDVCDNAPNKANRDQKDTDHDGVGDVVDNCIYHKNSDQLDKDLNNIGWVCDDQDKDRIINSRDNCVPYPNYNQSDKDNNGIGDVCEDIDGDGIMGYIDNCLYLKNQDQKDTDKDNIGDVCDNCLEGWNPNQLDLNEDGVGDICEDDDADGVPNYLDNCPQNSNSNQDDSDSDGIGNACDNCSDMKNPDQADSDRNGVGNICDDADGDGVINSRDNCPDFANADQKDQNNNGKGDVCEDSDGDGIINGLDNCPNKYNYNQSDMDKDGIGDECDTSDDRWTEKSSYLLWIILGFVALVVGFFAVRLVKKMGDEKEASSENLEQDKTQEDSSQKEQENNNPMQK